MPEFLTNIFGKTIIVHIIMGAVPLLFILPYALVVIYVEMKLSSHMQNRVGYMRTGWHGTLQPFADIFKLLQKENIVPAEADKILFSLAPFIVFIGMYAAYAVLPFGSGYVGSEMEIGIFYLLAVSSLVVVGILMAGWSSNNKWSLLGAMRSVAQIVSYEIPAALALLGVVMLAGTMNTEMLSAMQSGGMHEWFIFGGTLPLWKKFTIIPFMFIIFLVYLVSSMAEVNRTPFDLPEAESELVQGYNTEYSGMKFAIFYLAEYGNLFLISAIAVIVFFGGYTSPFGKFLSGGVWDVFWFITKGMLLVLINIWIRWTLPRLRVDQLMYVSWKVLTPFALVGIIVIGFILVV